MKKQQHTPGPWKIDDDFKTSTVITDDTDMVICRIHGSGPSADADGRLIAAAPDLLEALKRFVKVMDESYDYQVSSEVLRLREAANEARAAITKATGVAHERTHPTTAPAQAHHEARPQAGFVVLAGRIAFCPG